MTSFQDYLEPFQTESIRANGEFESSEMGSIIQSSFDPDQPAQIALFSVEEERGSLANAGTAAGAKEIRKYLYDLKKGDFTYHIVDLGSLKPGDQLSDTYFACKEVVKELLRHNCIPLLIGGSQDITLAVYMAYAELEQTVNLLEIAAKFALGNADLPTNSENYLSKVLLHQPNVLFNYSHLAYQSYFTDQKELKLLEDLHFDLHRLGIIKEDIRKAEPLLRNADFLTFNTNALSQAYFPSHLAGSPNGLNGEEACQLARYAGMSDKLSAIGFYEYNPSVDERGVSAHLIAQMIWYFMEGFYNRKSDFPACNKHDYTRYTVAVDEGKQEMVFYKSPKSDRWWMEVPYKNKYKNRYQRHLLLPCDYEDYKTAMENEIPESWLLTQQKLK